MSLEKLIADGRIHPSRIEEVVKEVQAEMEGVIRTKGTEATQEVDVHGLKKPVIDLLGRLNFQYQLQPKCTASQYRGRVHLEHACRNDGTRPCFGETLWTTSRHRKSG